MSLTVTGPGGSDTETKTNYVHVSELIPPAVREVKPCIGGPFYLKPWLTLVSHRYEAQVDWRGSPPSYVDFTLNGARARESPDGETASHTYNLGQDLRFNLLGTRNTLEVQAVAGNQAASSPYVLHPIGIDNPPWLPFSKMKQQIPLGCTGAPMKATWDILYPNPSFSGEVKPPSWFPFIGGQSFGVKETQAGLKAEFAGDGEGTANLFGQTGFDAAGNVVTGKLFGEGEGTIRESRGIELDRASFGLELEGTIEAKRPLVDIICKTITGGTCPLKEAEGIPVVGAVIRWFNERAVAQAQIQPGLNLILNFYGDPSGLKWESGTGTGKVRLTLSLILQALKNYLTAETYGGGEPSLTLQAPPNPSYLKRVATELFAGLKLKVWRWERKFEASYEWSYAPGGVSSLDASAIPGVRTLTVSGWQPIPRDYLADPATYAVFRANERPLRLGNSLATLGSGVGLLATEENTIATNVFPDGHPAIAADGSLLLLWVHDDVSKPLMQGEEVYYSIYNGATWSTPSGITNDDLQDFAPQVAFDRNDNAIAVWERNKVVQSGLSEFNAGYANTFEVAYAVWDGSRWNSPAFLTNNDALDHGPVLVRGNDGILLLIWRQNVAGELMGTAANPDTFFYALWNGVTWSTPQVLLSNARGVLGLAAARRDANTMAVVYSRDTDGDLSTSGDQELYLLTWNGSAWSSPTRLTNDGQPDNRPTPFYNQGGDLRLLWLKGYMLYALPNGLAGVPQAVTVEGSTAVLDYVAAQDNSGNLVLLWQGYSDEGVDVFYATYDQAHGVFSLVEQLTHDKPLEKFMAPAFAPTGEMVMAYNKTALVTGMVTVSPTLTVDNVTTFGQTDLYVLRHTFGPDLALEASDLAIAPSNPAPGSLARVSATLHNIGDRGVINPKVTFYLGDPVTGGAPIGTAVAYLTLTGGMTTTLSVNWVVPANGGPFAVYAIADPDEKVTELNESNNAASLFAAVPDLTIENVRVAYDSGQAIALAATLSNNGVVASAPATVAFRLDDPVSGTLVTMRTTPNLAAGTETEVQAVWDATGTPTGRHKIFAVADPEDAIIEADEMNNYEWAGVGILPDLVLRSTGVITSINADRSLLVNVSVPNEGLRDANGVTLGIYDQLPQSGVIPLISTTLNIPVGEGPVATLNLGHYSQSGFYIGVGINGEVEDRDVGNNILLVGDVPNLIYLPIILR